MTKFVLTVSGGGVRGIIVAQFLKRLEEIIQKPLHDTFDFYSGTSTGSIIVSGIAYNKLTGQEILDR